MKTNENFYFVSIEFVFRISQILRSSVPIACKDTEGTNTVTFGFSNTISQNNEK